MICSDFLSLKIKDLMRTNVVTVAADQSVYDAVQTMIPSNIGAVVVLEPKNGAVAGILTERDLMTRVIAKALDPKTTLVREVMTEVPATLGSQLPATEVFSLLKARNFRHVPIVDKGRLVGMISIRDVFEILHKIIGDALFETEK